MTTETKPKLEIKKDRLALAVAGISLCAVLGCSDETADTAGGTVQIAISGEDLATDGILFPTGSEVAIVDGWQLELSHVLVTIKDVVLARNPDKFPSDQAQTDEVVARARGPWAVDLHVEGTIPGASGEGKAIPLTVLEGQTEKAGAPFAPDERYAFGFDVTEASAEATLVNFGGDEDTEAIYAEMIESGVSVLYVGTATFKGEDCASSDPSYLASEIPSSVPFKLAFQTPVSAINCQNQDNQGDAFPDEAFQRGIAVPSNTSALAQITLHLEHALFSATEHDPSLYFDQMAAQLVGKPEGTTLTLDDFVGLDPTAFRDGAGNPLPFRSCDGSALPSGKQMRFDTGSVPVDPGAAPSEALRDYRDFLQYVQSAQGHLNGGEGLCFVERHYGSPD